MISDIDVINEMFGRVHCEGDDCELGDSARRPEIPNFGSLIDRNSYSISNSRENVIIIFAENGRSTSEISSDNNLNRERL